jgi:hypothetical protein
MATMQEKFSAAIVSVGGVRVKQLAVCDVYLVKYTRAEIDRYVDATGKQPVQRFLYVGMAGSLRVGQTYDGSIPVGATKKAEMLALGERLCKLQSLEKQFKRPLTDDERAKYNV